MRFLCDRNGLSMVEYILGGALVLAVVGMAIWNLAGAIAARFEAFNDSL
jgi:Flp pilus assembly pilin Flp